MPITPQRRIARYLTVAVLAMFAVACFRPIFPGSERIFVDRLDPRNGKDDVQKNAANGATSAALARKVVHGKESPATLIAPDGSRCTVTEERFREVKVGESVTCPWMRS